MISVLLGHVALNKQPCVLFAVWFMSNQLRYNVALRWSCKTVVATVCSTGGAAALSQLGKVPAAVVPDNATFTFLDSGQYGHSWLHGNWKGGWCHDRATGTRACELASLVSVLTCCCKFICWCLGWHAPSIAACRMVPILVSHVTLN